MNRRTEVEGQRKDGNIVSAIDVSNARIQRSPRALEPNRSLRRELDDVAVRDDERE